MYICCSEKKEKDFISFREKIKREKSLRHVQLELNWGHIEFKSNTLP